MKDDIVHLLSLVALLISTAGFKNELSSIKLGDTDFTLFTVFIIASVLFGGLLYLHLLLNGTQLLRQAWREKTRAWVLIVLRFIFVAMLTLIPLGVVFISASNWLVSEQCSQEYVSNSYLDPLGLDYDPSTSQTETVCRTPLMGYVVPTIATIAFPLVLFIYLYNSEKEFRKLSSKAKQLSSEITNLRIMQAMSSNLEKNEILEIQIKSLLEEFAKEKINTDE
jgi:hypothetical protein